MDSNASLMHLLQEKRKFPPEEGFAKQAWVRDLQQFEHFYQQSIEQPDRFWLEQCQTLNWDRFPTKGCEYTWDTNNRIVEHTWFEDGLLNVAYNCLDRHLSTRGKKTALIWQGEKEEETITYSYWELAREVRQFANVLKKFGLQKGDRVCLYLPMIPQLTIAMLACARLGIIHTVVFGGYSAESLAHRINDCQCRLVVTSNVALRNGIKLSFKDFVDTALEHCPTVETLIVVERTFDPWKRKEGRDFAYSEELAAVSDECPPAILAAEDPLFILYTSGSTGKPKGVVHTQAGYLLQTALTHKLVFDVHDEDVYWCTADLGWVTGHSYGVYGPLANGSTSVMYESTPTYPDAGRLWQIVEKLGVTLFYTAPTVIRALIRAGTEYPAKYDLSKLRVLGTVGEPINPEVWIWYHEHIGRRRCPIVDTWWQTETGAIMLAPLPGCHILKPGSALQPFLGIQPNILKPGGEVCERGEGGALCISRPWPSIMRTMWGDHERFIDTYFTSFENMYFTGDGCLQDEEGDYWLLGRMDDVVNVSGHRIGTAEVESALVSHAKVAEAAVVAIPHDVKGQGLCAFVTLIDEQQGSEALRSELLLQVRKEIGPIAVPEKIVFAKGLPKTRSGKIMRRILRKIASGEFEDLGDISTLADPSVIQELTRENRA